jgi:Malate synthase
MDCCGWEELTVTTRADTPGLVDRRAGITGPTTRKMTVNALNPRANAWLADGPLVTNDVVERMIDEELGKIRELADSFAEFLTLPAYERMP